MTSAVQIGPLTLAVMTRDEAVSWIVQRARAGEAAVVVTSNIQHLSLAESDAAFRKVVADAELNVADGWPLVAVSRLGRTRGLPERVAGVDLVERTLAAPVQFRLAILGGPPGAAARLASLVASQHEVVVVDPLPPGEWDDEDSLAELMARVRAARPDLTLIALDAPKRELLADRLRQAAAGPIICCGAAVEILAGVRPRAPKWMQRIGLEWAFRSLLEPKRLLPRYISAARTFSATLVRELWARRL